LSGTDCPIGPYLAICDMPLESKDCGRGALRAVRAFSMGDLSSESLGGDPKADRGGEFSAESKVG
jgi:hypothetical protein